MTKHGLEWKNFHLSVINTNNSIDSKYIDLIKCTSGTVLPGELVAIMGPSGSGKSTLLNALAGRIPPNSITQGSIKYNDIIRSGNSWFDIVGFVKQEASFLNELTVLETLKYCYRFSKKKTNNQMKKTFKDNKTKNSEVIITNISDNTFKPKQPLNEAQILDKIINELNLKRVRNNLMKSLSGGEKKRTAIGSILINDPSILLLDEPTSGLDALTSLNLLKILKKLALEYNKIIIMTIHQPSLEIFYMFSQLFLLSEGNVLFQGKVDSVENFFLDKGFVKRELITLPEHIMEICNYINSDQNPEFMYNENIFWENNTFKIDERKCVKQNEYCLNLKPSLRDVSYLIRRGILIFKKQKVVYCQFLILRILIILTLLISFVLFNFVTDTKDKIVSLDKKDTSMFNIFKPSIKNMALIRILCYSVLIGMQFKTSINHFSEDVDRLKFEIENQNYTASTLYIYLLISYIFNELIIGFFSIIFFKYLFSKIDKIVLLIFIATPFIIIPNGILIASLVRKREFCIVLTLLLTTIFSIPLTIIHKFVVKIIEKSTRNALIAYVPYFTWIFAIIPPIYFSALINHLIEINQDFYYNKINNSQLTGLKYLYNINLNVPLLLFFIPTSTIFVFLSGFFITCVKLRPAIRLKTEKCLIK